jgi:hypothetical protein
MIQTNLIGQCVQVNSYSQDDPLFCPIVYVYIDRGKVILGYQNPDRNINEIDALGARIKLCM